MVEGKNAEKMNILKGRFESLFGDEYEDLEILNIGFSILMRGYNPMMEVTELLEAFDTQTLKKIGLSMEEAEQKIREQAMLDHPNIIQITDVMHTDEYLIIIMESPSEEHLSEITTSPQDLTKEEARKYLLQLINGVEYLHEQNILHLDLRPDNIFVQGGQIKISDFNISVLAPSRPTKFATYMYVSPERINGEQISGKMDCWAIGCIYYLLSLGQLPFSGTHLELLNNIQNINYIKPEQVDQFDMKIIEMTLVKEDERKSISELKEFIILQGFEGINIMAQPEEEVKTPIQSTSKSIAPKLDIATSNSPKKHSKQPEQEESKNSAISGKEIKKSEAIVGPLNPKKTKNNIIPAKSQEVVKETKINEGQLNSKPKKSKTNTGTCKLPEKTISSPSASKNNDKQNKLVTSKSTEKTKVKINQEKPPEKAKSSKNIIKSKEHVDEPNTKLPLKSKTPKNNITSEKIPKVIEERKIPKQRTPKSTEPKSTINISQVPEKLPADVTQLPKKSTETPQLPEKSIEDAKQVYEKSTESPQLSEKLTEDAPKVPEKATDDVSQLPEKSNEDTLQLSEKSTEDAPQLPEKSAEDTPQLSEKSTEDAPQLPKKSAEDTPQLSEKSTEDAPQLPKKSAEDTPQLSEKSTEDTPQLPKKPKEKITQKKPPQKAKSTIDIVKPKKKVEESKTRLVPQKNNIISVNSGIEETKTLISELKSPPKRPIKLPMDKGNKEKEIKRELEFPIKGESEFEKKRKGIRAIKGELRVRKTVSELEIGNLLRKGDRNNRLLEQVKELEKEAKSLESLALSMPQRHVFTNWFMAYQKAVNHEGYGLKPFPERGTFRAATEYEALLQVKIPNKKFTDVDIIKYVPISDSRLVKVTRYWECKSCGYKQYNQECTLKEQGPAPQVCPMALEKINKYNAQAQGLKIKAKQFKIQANPQLFDI